MWNPETNSYYCRNWNHINIEATPLSLTFKLHLIRIHHNYPVLLLRTVLHNFNYLVSGRDGFTKSYDVYHQLEDDISGERRDALIKHSFSSSPPSSFPLSPLSPLLQCWGSNTGPSAIVLL